MANRKILLTVSYDGTDFHGSAYLQGTRTVEGEVMRAVSEVTGEKEIVLTGASRTDAGVHAYGNLMMIETAVKMPADKFAPAINTHLPSDVRVLFSEEMREDFHPRKTGWPKTYEYHILNAEYPDPMLRNFTYHYRSPLDVQAMNEAAAAFVGTHDYTSFCSVHAQSLTRERTIYSCEVVERILETDRNSAGEVALLRNTQNEIKNAKAEDKSANRETEDESAGNDTGEKSNRGGEKTNANSFGKRDDDFGNNTAGKSGNKKMIIIRVCGSGFLYNMVRIIAGTLLDVGRGKNIPADIAGMLAAKDRGAAGATLEPQGLFLMGYERNA